MKVHSPKYHLVLRLLFITYILVGVFLAEKYIFTRFNQNILGTSTDLSDTAIIALVNLKRAEAGITPLTSNTQLTQAAQLKVEDMITNRYFAHTGNNNREPWEFITASGYLYQSAGENLARGYQTTEAVVDAWMGSTSHKNNLLSPLYRETGVAIIEDPNNPEQSPVIAQLFATPYDPLIANQSESWTSGGLLSLDKLRGRVAGNLPLIGLYLFTFCLTLIFFFETSKLSKKPKHKLSPHFWRR
jgi:hypothetical protein